jgi:hypothetical protein
MLWQQSGFDARSLHKTTRSTEITAKMIVPKLVRREKLIGRIDFDGWGKNTLP